MPTTAPRRRDHGLGAFIATAVIVAGWLVGMLVPAARGQAGNSAQPVAGPVVIAPSAPIATAVAVPRSFLGLSQEWPWVAGMVLSRQGIDILRHLENDNGPLILRVGGTTFDAGYDRVMHGTTPADLQARAGVEKMFDALQTLRDALGMRFIITLTLAQRDPALVARQAEECRARLGDAIIAFEVGNEPNYYKDLRRDLWPDDGTGRFYRDIVEEFAAGVRAVGETPCAGPAWGWIGLKPVMLEQYLRAAAGRLALTTVHYYHSAYFQTPPPGRVNDTPETLLDDGHTREILSTWIAPQVAVARAHGVPLRITESNSISGGGHAGVSDVYAAALWTLDTMLEMAAAGVAGIDFHQASPNYALLERVTPGDPRATPDDPPPLYHSYRVKPPFYGLLFFQRAVTAGARITRVAHAGPAAVKAYHVAVGRESRTILVNKSPREPVALEVRLVVPAGTTGRLMRLAAPDDSITARTGITLAGVHYDAWGGVPNGEPTEEVVPDAGAAAGGTRRFRLSLSPASAAMLTTPQSATPP
jgi:hypothetical protein